MLEKGIQMKPDSLTVSNGRVLKLDFPTIDPDKPSCIWDPVQVSYTSPLCISQLPLFAVNLVPVCVPLRGCVNLQIGL